MPPAATLAGRPGGERPHQSVKVPRRHRPTISFKFPPPKRPNVTAPQRDHLLGSRLPTPPPPAPSSPEKTPRARRRPPASPAATTNPEKPRPRVASPDLFAAMDLFSAMDLFADGIHVRLRSRVHGTYLYADDDGVGVSLRPRSYDPPLAGVWRVHRVQRHGIDYALLHGAAYGRYLALSPGEPAPRWCRGWRAVQRGYDDPEQNAVMWRPAMSTAGGRPGDYVLMRHILNGTLRANGRFRIWNNVVSIDEYFGTRSTMRHWTVEVVPPRQGPPPLPIPTVPNLGGCSILFWRRKEPEASRRRRIRCLRSDQPLNFRPANVPAFHFYGRSVFNLRNQVGIRANEDGEFLDTIMCVQAGLYGRLTPLVTDLHHSEEPMNIVIYRAGAPDAQALVYPDADAQGP